MVERGSIADRGELWFDVRPHTGHGTVGRGARPGRPARPRVTLAFVEYVHALVVDYAERYADGESPPTLRRELLDENKWRAIRHGHDASFITRDGEDTVSLGEAVADVRPPRNRRDPRRVRRREREPAPAPTPRGEGGLDALCDDLMLSP